MGASSGRAWSELAWRACDSIAVIRSQSISHAQVIATCDLAIGIDVRERVKARVRGGLAMCLVAPLGCGAGAPRRNFWGYVITFN